MIGFTSKGWTILPQTKQTKDGEIEMACKPIRWMPYTDDEGETQFRPLVEHWSYQVILGKVNLPTEMVKIKMTMHYDKIKGIKIEYKDIPTTPTPQWAQPVFGREVKKPAPPVKPLDTFPLEKGLAEVARRFGGDEMRMVIDNLFVEAIEQDAADKAERDQKRQDAYERKIVKAERKAERAAKKAAKAAKKLAKAA